jgi:nicotinate-nucleotide adenylyltransferase
MSKPRIGLMGGTFDPIHYGHLFIAEEARVRCRLDRVLFVPARQPAHIQGKTAHAGAEERLRLTRLAVQGHPDFAVSRVELDRPGPSYTIDTVQQLRTMWDNEIELFYIVGGDSIGELLTWHRAGELLRQCRFIAFARESYSTEAARQRFSAEQQTRIEWLATLSLPISSTDLRRRVRENLPIRYLTPDAVVEEVARRRLYLQYDD